MLNGEAGGEANGIVNFMHDSQLDRSESQLSPLAAEFQPSSPEAEDGKGRECERDELRGNMRGE